MLLTARAEARCSQASRTDFRCSCSLPFLLGSNFFVRVLPLLCLAACAPSVFDGLTCVFSGLAPSQLAVMPPCRSPRISPHFGEHVRPHDHSLQVCLASLYACCGASQHERPHVCWLVGCLLLKYVPLDRPVLRCVLRLCVRVHLPGALLCRLCSLCF